MKKLYQKPEMSIAKMIELEAADIIRTSGEVETAAPKSLTDYDSALTYTQLTDSEISVFN